MLNQRSHRQSPSPSKDINSARIYEIFDSSAGEKLSVEETFRPLPEDCIPEKGKRETPRDAYNGTGPHQDETISHYFILIISINCFNFPSGAVV